VYLKGVCAGAVGARRPSPVRWHMNWDGEEGRFGWYRGERRPAN
jgi:hypothetical protein